MLNTAHAYGYLTKTLHWVTFALVLALGTLGYGYSTLEVFDDPAIAWHQRLGWLGIVIVTLRLALYAVQPKPAPVETHKPLERKAARTVHILLYVLLLAFFVTGVFNTSDLRDGSVPEIIPRSWVRADWGEAVVDAHFALKYILAGLLFLHIGGALKHAVIDRDGTLRRML